MTKREEYLDARDNVEFIKEKIAVITEFDPEDKDLSNLRIELNTAQTKVRTLKNLL